ncbi:MAG TPA: hypothetical protein VHB01_05735 [Nitrosospira sp.]|nr:hypothetical protein [Nitrosospira sp.]
MDLAEALAHLADYIIKCCQVCLAINQLKSSNADCGEDMSLSNCHISIDPIRLIDVCNNNPVLPWDWVMGW